MPSSKKYSSVDLFSGCGGLTKGMSRAGFQTQVAIENNSYASMAYKLNFNRTTIIQKDIRKVSAQEVKQVFQNAPIHLLAGCPPCQGFSSVRKLNKPQSVRDTRNSLVLEFLRFVKKLEPYTIMMENVAGLANYYQFRRMVSELRNMGYNPKYDVVNVMDYGVPQSRERLVLVGSRLAEIEIEEGNHRPVTVRETIGALDRPRNAFDPFQKIVPDHSDRIKKMISLIPKDGGSRKDLPKRYILECHKSEEIGFSDIYGRLRWDQHATTITGGCLNPSKGRFLHPRQNRVITPREAAMLQSFPKTYKFPLDIPKAELALMIGNALPPTFSYYQSKNIKKHLDTHLG